VNLNEIVVVVLCLTVVAVLAVVFALIASRRPINLHLQECRNCGAQNHNGKKHGYGCGFALAVPRSDRASLPGSRGKSRQMTVKRDGKSELKQPSPNGNHMNLYSFVSYQTTEPSPLPAWYRASDMITGLTLVKVNR
jgi:hypothetical protein